MGPRRPRAGPHGQATGRHPGGRRHRNTGLFTHSVLPSVGGQRAGQLLSCDLFSLVHQPAVHCGAASRNPASLWPSVEKWRAVRGHRPSDNRLGQPPSLVSEPGQGQRGSLLGCPRRFPSRSLKEVAAFPRRVLLGGCHPGRRGCFRFRSVFCSPVRQFQYLLASTRLPPRGHSPIRGRHWEVHTGLGHEPRGPLHPHAGPRHRDLVPSGTPASAPHQGLRQASGLPSACPLLEGRLPAWGLTAEGRGVTPCPTAWEEKSFSAYPSKSCLD